MNYIIWGAGMRGERAYSLIGKDKIVAFIDRSKTGETFKEKPVLTLDETRKRFPKAVYIITPMASTASIMKKLDDEGIYAKFALDEAPMEYAFVDDEKKLFDLYPIKLEKRSCILYGLTVFTILFYEYLEKNGIEVSICLSEQEKNVWYNLLAGEFKIVMEPFIHNKDTMYVVIKDREGRFTDRKDVFFIEDLIHQNTSFYSSDIRKFKDIGKGKRCFIVATGPSLRVEDLETLYEHKEICFSMNKIYNIFSQTSWRPDYYMAQDAHMIDEVGDVLANLDVPNKFIGAIPSGFWKRNGTETAVKFYSVLESISDKMPGFSCNPDIYMYDGKTVSYACLQMAIYMGFKEIYLIGVDFNYETDIHSENNHFVGYHGGQKDLNLFPFQYACVAKAYMVAKDYAEKAGLKIYNATRGGKLEIFERVDFDTLFA